MSKWKPKPGDVAIIEGKVALYVDGPHIPRKRGPFWQWGSGGWTTLPLGPQHPLAVIDPEDREQVERLRDAYDRAFVEQNPELSETPEWKGKRGNALQAALREFANPTPPKPPEPQGLGAVVEDDEGVRWVRYDLNLERSYRWISERGASEDYQDITAVRVLSEGVAP